MKDTNHRYRHGSRHPDGGREVVGSLEVAHDATIDLDAGKTPEWAGATPHLEAFGCPKESWGRSSPANSERLGLPSVLPVSSGQRKRRKVGELMSIINKPPEMVKREYELQEPIAVAVEKYAAFIASTPDHVVNSAFKMVLWRDADFRGWRKQQRLRLNEKKAQALRRRRERDSKNPPREELPCLHPRGDRNGALFSGAISVGQSLPPHHRHSVVSRLSLFQVLLHPLHDTVHRLFRPPLRGLYFRAQGHPHNSGRKITRLPGPCAKNRTFAGCRRAAPSAHANAVGNTALAGHPGTRTVYWYRHRGRGRVPKP